MSDLRGPAAATAAVAALAAAGSWAAGLGAAPSAMVAWVVAITGAGHVVVSRHQPERAWPRRGEERRRHGTRREVSRLSWNLAGRRRPVPAPTCQRLRVLAARRLDRLGVDLDDPGEAGRARALLGASAYGVLIADPSQPVDQAAFLRCVAAVERLDDLPASGGPGPGVGPEGDR